MKTKEQIILTAYIQPQIKIKQLAAESLLAGESLPVDENGGETIGSSEEIEAKEMPSYSVWEE